MRAERLFRIAFTMFEVGLFCTIASCTDSGSEAHVTPLISTDNELFQLITSYDPLTSYILFPHADSVTSGTLNGSTAHQPLVRVSLNSEAFRTLESGYLPSGASFPNGSTVLKQIITNNQTVLYAIMHKDSANPSAAHGWLWAEYRPDGSTAHSLTNRGIGCIDCHARDQGPVHDFVRTFERQY
jgi:hypothetical protein